MTYVFVLKLIKTAQQYTRFLLFLLLLFMIKLQTLMAEIPLPGGLKSVATMEKLSLAHDNLLSKIHQNIVYL